ncbi:MAG TPA: T9SS type A sorting domain-containing protein [Ignavibacteriaceae bacterium]|nr:T9SS type A sorting domain-containing protein [Ignavibacteriaceae bacterium]
MNKICILFFLMMIIVSSPFAKIIKVPADQLTIQEAIISSEDGDTVVVYPGTYYENIKFMGKKILLTSRFYETGDLDYILSTIIDGSQPKHADTASCVLFINHEDSTSILQGFTITGGKGTIWRDEHGAGDYREGGGILTASASPIIRYNLIIRNEIVNRTGVNSTGGGGIRSGDGNPKILNNIITLNTARYGAGVVLNYTGAAVKNNLITYNNGGEDYGGGALWMNHDGAKSKVIENNTIVNNPAKGGGIYVYQGSSVVRSCVVWGNTSSSAAQIGVRSGGPVVSFSDVQGGRTGIGNIDSDPQFDDDLLFHLSTASPCVDSGDTAIIFNDQEDSQSPGFARAPSLGGLRNDMGAYGGPGAFEFPLYNPPTEVPHSGTLLPAKFKLEQNFPNPFNPATAIVYSIPERAFVSLKIIDALGKEVEKLINNYQEAGSYRINFNAGNLSSGIYFIKLQADNFADIKKCILIK